jgi:hypothetical protein
MTNINTTPEKLPMRQFLRNAAINALEGDGWKVERVARSGKSSVRRITKGNVSKVVTIRTTQDKWIAFPRVKGDTAWRTLDEVDDVVAASVDDKENPRKAYVHLMDGDNIRDRFNRAYKARKDAGHSIPVGRGVWVSLYEKEQKLPVQLVGAGAGLEFKPIAEIPIDMNTILNSGGADDEDDVRLDEVEAPVEREAAASTSVAEAPLTIAEAKRRLAATLGVDISAIKITIEG